jgi:hypothetical protein
MSIIKVIGKLKNKKNNRMLKGIFPVVKCLFLLILGMELNAYTQTTYWVYKAIRMDTVKIKIDTLLPGIPPILQLPFKTTDFICYIKQGDYVLKVAKNFSPVFSKVPDDYVNYSSGIGVRKSNEKYNIKEIIELPSKKRYNPNTCEYVKLNPIPNLKSEVIHGNIDEVTTQNLIKYSLNKDIYFIVDPKGNPNINPGLFASYIKGSIVEIKTLHFHYKLFMAKELPKAFKKQEFDEVIQLIPTFQSDSLIFPFISDNKPTSYIKGGKFIPTKE